MSGRAPYAYLEYGYAIASLGFSALEYLYDADSMTQIDLGYNDLFQGGCVAVRPAESDVLAPIGTYDVRYPYCRIALTYNMADVRGNPQVGQFVPQAPFFAIILRLIGCDKSSPVGVSVNAQPTQTNCVVSLYPGYSPTDFYVVVDAGRAVYPMRLYFTITNGSGITRTFWIGIRDRRDGLISGAVVPTHG